MMRRLLTEGLSPEKVSLAVALGIALGLNPIYGPVTLLSLVLAFLLRLNKPLVVAACYTMSLVKPVLIIPFLKFGEWIFQADPMPISLVELSDRFAASPLATLREFAWSFLHATAGWLVTAPVVMVAVYLVCLAVIRRWQTQRSAFGRPGPDLQKLS